MGTSSLENRERRFNDVLTSAAGVLSVTVEHVTVVNIHVDSPDKATRYGIYDKQAILMAEFPDEAFDFNLVESYPIQAAPPEPKTETGENHDK